MNILKILIIILSHSFLFSGIFISGGFFFHTMTANSAVPKKSKIKRKVMVEKIRGKVHLIRKGKKVLLQTEAFLKQGDVIVVGKNSKCRIKSNEFFIDLAPWTVIEIQTRTVNLIYGHGYFVLKKALKVILPTATLESSIGSFLVHAVKDEREFNLQILGSTITKPPSYQDLQKLKNSPMFFTQVSCLNGRVYVKPKNSTSLLLKPGEITKLFGSVGDPLPVPVALIEIKNQARALGYKISDANSR